MSPSPSGEYPDVMEDMDDDLLGLLKDGLDSFIKWDVIKFFYLHPNAIYPARDLAHQMNRDAASLETELNELAAAGIIDCCQGDPQPMFSRAKDPAACRLVEKFMRACEDRYFRMKVVYHILRAAP